MVINRFEVYPVNLDPTGGGEIRKTRPCLIVSPDEINHTIRTVIIAPMTTKGQIYPTRIPCRFKGKDGQVVLDQMRRVDRSRLVAKLGRISGGTVRPCWTCSGRGSNHRWTASASRSSFPNRSTSSNSGSSLNVLQMELIQFGSGFRLLTSPLRAASSFSTSSRRFSIVLVMARASGQERET